MPITVNEGGVLHELETVTSNEGGVLYELDTVHANEGGVLYEIHSAASFPDSLTWEYSYATTSYTPTVSNNGFTVKNTRSDNACLNVKSNVFEIKGSVRVNVSITFSGKYDGNSGGFTIRTENGEIIEEKTSTSSGTLSITAVLTTGKYYIIGGSSGGGQSGSGANSYTISVSFSK